MATTRRTLNLWAGHVLVLLAVSGEVDVTNSPDLHRELARAAHTPNVATVVVDLSRVTFIDAAAVDELAVARRDLARTGAEMSVVGATGIVFRVLDLSDLTGYLDVSPPVGRG